jgi:SAM-dependent methyltransferase
VPSAYDLLGTLYDTWCRAVVEDIPFYVDLALESGGPMLEVGVGSGRVAIPTALAGVAVTGVDSSEEMLDLAWAKALAHRVSLRLVRADMLALPDLGRFRLATVPFRALLHLHDDRQRLAVLEALRDRLEPGGVLAFDVFHPDEQDIADTHGLWLQRELGIYERALWDAERKRLDMTVRAHGVEAQMDLAWAEPDDWRRLIYRAGFVDVESYGWFDRRPLKPGAADSVWIARKPHPGSDP